MMTFDERLFLFFLLLLLKIDFRTARENVKASSCRKPLSPRADEGQQGHPADVWWINEYLLCDRVLTIPPAP